MTTILPLAVLALYFLVHGTSAFSHRAARAASTNAFSSRSLAVKAATDGQAEVVLVGCGAPNRGMGWYHAVQMLEKR